MKKRSVCLVSLGCPKNQVDSELLLGGLLDAGVEHVEDPTVADAVLINTCGFIRDAKEEAIETIFRHVAIKDERPGFLVAVAGCLVQRYGDELRASFPEVDVWLDGTGSRAVRPLLLRLGVATGRALRARPRLLNAPGTAYLKVSEGCDNRCAYCAIPLIKGGLVSRPLPALLREARELVAEHGVKEMVLVAQDLTSYGKDLGLEDGLTRLLEGLLRIDLPWIRLMYTYPLRLARSTVELMRAEPRICRYLDVPIQHADGSVLRRMGRRGGPVAMLRWFESLRRSLPGLVLRSTVLVGHPGETPAAFRTLCTFLRRVGFEWLGAFPYSPEEGTRSEKLEAGRVPPSRARARARTVDRIFVEARRLESFGVGSVKEALVEAVEDGVAVCRSRTEAPEVDGVILAAIGRRPDPVIGSLVPVRVDAVEGLDFIGDLV